MKKKDNIKINDLIQIFGICNTVSLNEDLTISISSINKLDSFNYLCHHHLLVFHDYLKYQEEERRNPIEDKSRNDEDDLESTQNNENAYFNTFFY